MLRLFKFQGLWLSLAHSCRPLIDSIALGLSELVVVSRSLPNVSGYSYAGWQHFSDNVCSFAIVGAVSGHAVLEMTRDDRLALKWEKLLEDTQEEVSILQSHNAKFWEFCSSLLADPKGAQLRISSIHSALTTIAYAKHKTPM